MSIDLVTGGAGFIGSHLVRRLVQVGRQVRVVDDLSTGDLRRLDDVSGSFQFIQADLAHAELEPIMEDVARIFHLAAIPSVPRSVADPIATHTSVVTATLRLLVAARRTPAPRFVLSSSSSVYGDSDATIKHEGLPCRPLSPYAAAKAAAESYARVYGQLHGVPTVILRYFNVFGPGQDPSSAYAAVVPRFIRSALAGEPLTVFGDGRQTRDFTYVDNVVDANIRATEASVTPGDTFNIAAGAPRTVNELVNAIARLTGLKLDVRYAVARSGDIVHSHADISRARSELGWEPSVTFEDGLRSTVEWYRSR